MVEEMMPEFSSRTSTGQSLPGRRTILREAASSNGERCQEKGVMGGQGPHVPRPLIDPLCIPLHPSLWTAVLSHGDYINEVPCSLVSSRSQPLGSTRRKEENEGGLVLLPLSRVGHCRLTLHSTEGDSPYSCSHWCQERLPPVLLHAWGW